MVIKTNQLVPYSHATRFVAIFGHHGKGTPLAVSKDGLWRLHLGNIDPYNPVGYIEVPLKDGYITIFLPTQYYTVK